ncbi:uncharacterized protein LOC118442679 [Vespa mandarinia]|uniref:uncharacterized protein LOC118442679 n=1 Tax=Vespa mandarinia TaxID=7446 RepID=UPI00161CB73C|nr:uncharacterized protein LOC118442679 [Vespa mandarinia]
MDPSRNIQSYAQRRLEKKNISKVKIFILLRRRDYFQKVHSFEFDEKNSVKKKKRRRNKNDEEFLYHKLIQNCIIHLKALLRWNLFMAAMAAASLSNLTRPTTFNVI